MKRLIKARTSIEFDNELQPNLINGDTLIKLDDEYMNLAKKILRKFPIMPTSERIYDTAKYLSLYKIEDINNDFDTYVELCKNYLKNTGIQDLKYKVASLKRIASEKDLEDIIYDSYKQYDDSGEPIFYEKDIKIGRFNYTFKMEVVEYPDKYLLKFFIDDKFLEESYFLFAKDEFLVQEAFDNFIDEYTRKLSIIAKRRKRNIKSAYSFEIWANVVFEKSNAGLIETEDFYEEDITYTVNMKEDYLNFIIKTNDNEFKVSKIIFKERINSKQDVINIFVKLKEELDNEIYLTR